MSSPPLAAAPPPTASPPIELFVGDLALDVNDARLHAAFAHYSSLVDARVIWDTVTGRTRGYGFVSFRDAVDANSALHEMHGQWVGSRTVRLRRAHRRIIPAGTSITAAAATSAVRTYIDGQELGFDVAEHAASTQPATTARPPPPLHTLSPTLVASVLTRSPVLDHRAVYLGNLPFHVQQPKLLACLHSYGITVQDARVHSEHGYAFILLASPDEAARAILALHGCDVLGRVCKAAWGKEHAFEDPGTSRPYKFRDGMAPPTVQAPLPPPMRLMMPAYIPFPGAIGTPPAFLMSPTHYPTFSPAFSPASMVPGMMSPMGPFTPPTISSPSAQAIIAGSSNGGTINSYFDMSSNQPQPPQGMCMVRSEPPVTYPPYPAFSPMPQQISNGASAGMYYGFSPGPNQISAGASGMYFMMGAGGAGMVLPPPMEYAMAGAAKKANNEGSDGSGAGPENMEACTAGTTDESCM